MHERGILHRDVKPANILLDAAGRPLLTDFGIATARDVERLTRPARSSALRLLRARAGEGSPTRVGPWTDTWSLGAVLFHMLAGEPPLALAAPLATSRSCAPRGRSRGPVGRARRPGGLAAIVARALDKDLAHRYASCTEVAEELERFLTGQTPRALADGPRAAPRRAFPRGLSLGVVLAIAVVAASGWAVARRRARATAFEDARLDVGRGQVILRRSADSPVPPSLELAGLRSALELGRAELRAAELDPEDERARATASDLDRIAGALETLTARRALATGDPRSALTHLEAAPPGTLDAEGRFLHASALARLGRVADALRELEAFEANPADPRRPEAAELVGDLVLASDPAKAALAYGAAVETSGPRSIRARAKRAGALALAGQDQAALRDLALALPPGDEAAVDSSDPRAPGAPAIYLRALDATTPAELATLLEAASRLGPEPAVLRARVARAWNALAADEAGGLTWLSLKRTLEPTDVAGVRRTFQHFARARALDPSVDSHALWGGLAAIRVWGKKVDAATATGIATMLLQDLPDNPELLLLLAETALAESRGLSESTTGLLRRAARQILAHPEDPDPEIARIGLVVIRLWVGGDNRDPVEPADLDLVERLADRVDELDGYWAVAYAFGRSGLPGRGAALVDHVRQRRGESDADYALLRHRVRVRVLRLAKRDPDAIELARKVYEQHPGDERYGQTLAHILVDSEPARAVELFPGEAGRYSDIDLLVDLGDAHVRLGHLDLAQAFSRRLESLHAGDRAFWVHPDKKPAR